MYSSFDLYSPLYTESRCSAPVFLKYLLSSTLQTTLARALLTPFQSLANTGSYRINSPFYIYPLKYPCSPEFTTINGNLSGIKQGNCNIRIVFISLKNYWKLPTGSKPEKRNRMAKEARGKGRRGLTNEI
jgi:hypothetical protein